MDFNEFKEQFTEDVKQGLADAGIDAMLLYGLLLNRVSLSSNSGWFDREKIQRAWKNLDNLCEKL